MSIISSRNSLSNEQWVPFTKMSHSEVVGTAVVRWENPSGFSASWAIQLGQTGDESSEVKVLSTDTPAGTAGTVTAATDFSHAADTPIYGIKYDKVVFGQTTGTNIAGTVATLTNGTIDYAADSFNTIFDYSSGTSTDVYKTKFRNSVTGDESALSDWIYPDGLEFHMLGKIRERTKAKLFSAGYIKNDETINDWLNEWRETMVNAAVDVNEDYSVGTLDIAFSGTTELGTITNEDFKLIRRVWMTSNGTSFERAIKMEQIDFSPDQIFSDFYPRFYMVADNVIGRKPNEASGTARIAYYSTGTVLTNDSDELPHSMRSYTKSFVHYGLSQAFLKDGKNTLFQNEIALANAELERFKTQIVPRNRSSQTQIKYVEATSADDYFI